MAEAIAYVALALAAASAYKQTESAKAQAKDQEKASKTQTAMQKAADIAALRQKAREERIRRAQIAQQAVNTGVEGSSGMAGALAGLQQNLGINRSFQAGQAIGAESISRSNQRIANLQVDQAEWAAVGQISNAVFGATSSSIFDVNANTTSKPTSVGSGGGGGTPSWKRT